MPVPDVTAADVTAALDEFDDIGRQGFLGKYEFGEARRYFVTRDGKYYDSKAIVGAAHTLRHGIPLRAADFSGGEATVKRLLESLGFVVEVRPTGSPTSALVTEESLGAWVMKCNPDIWGLANFLASGGKVIDDWTVLPNYRSDLIRYGQRVLLWVTGPAGGPLPRGFWGSGWTTGEVFPLLDNPDDLDTTAGVDDDFWLEPESASECGSPHP